MTTATANMQRNSRSSFVLLGVPLGDFGLLASLLLSFSLGFTAFFGGTFLAIIALLFYNQSGHHNADYANSYRMVGLPAGVVVLVLSLTFFGILWIRRKVAGR